jgi:hypothetical protein
MNHHSETNYHPQGEHRLALGIVLISIGIAILLARWLNLDDYLVLLIGAGLLGWGALSRRPGLIIPGGVLAGIGLGIMVYEGPWIIPATNPNGLFLLCFALGWFLITLLTGLFTRCTLWWPIIPGGIMAVLGGAVLLTGNARIVQDQSALIPSALLILIGMYLIIRWSRGPNHD